MRFRYSPWRPPVWLFLLLALASCISVPEQVQLTHNGANLPACEPVQPLPQRTGTRALDSQGFTLASWNIYKGALPGWRRDLQWLHGQADVLLLQESYLAPEMLRWLTGAEMDWSMAHAFTYRGYWSGVLTASRVPQLRTCALRAMEPLVHLPKTALVSWLPLKGQKIPLLVINLHGINFTFDEQALARQLDALETFLARHEGPAILAGDMNTWSLSRQAVVQALAKRQGLQRVEFQESPTRFMDRQIDHVYYRGLQLVRSRVLQVRSSDHLPLIVTFRSQQP